MENRKRHLKAHRRNVTRKNNSTYGRSFKLHNSDLSINRSHLTSSSSNSTSMKAFMFNTDSLGRNQYFNSIPKECTDRRIVKYQNSPKTLLLKSPSIKNILQSTFILGGLNSCLNLKNIHNSERSALEYYENISRKSSPSDFDVIFGNAKKLFSKTYGWQEARIQWLVDLERRQEGQRSRQQCYEEDLLEMICCFPLSLNMLT